MMAKNDNKKVLLIDGSFYLQLSEVNPNIIKKINNRPMWTAQLLLDDLETVKQVHLHYLRAGCDIIETNTYQASIDGLIKYLNLDKQKSRELIINAVKIARQACNEYKKESQDTRKILVAGSMGPYGCFLHDCSEYNGNYINTVSADEIREYHRTKMDALVEAGVDLLAIETIPVQAEAEILVNLLKEFPQIKAWLSFSCKDAKNICSGENFVDAVKKSYRLNPKQLIAVGINCTNPEYVEGLIKDLQDEDDIPVVVYPNSGEEFEMNKWVGKEHCKPLDSYIENWMKLNVKFIGGCCRLNAQDIAEVRKKLDKLQN